MFHAPRSTPFAPRCHLPSPICYLLALAVFAACGSIAPLASGQQGVLEKTTLGSSQNDYRDLENSLIPGKKRYDKGEKKEEVDVKTLQSKSIKDTTFQGTLMDVDLDWHGAKLGKPGGNGDKDSKASKTADAGGEKDSNVSRQADASAEKDPKASKSTQGGDDQNKDQKAKSAAADEKASEKEKASATKPDGDH
jgi:hypothetical protein